MLIVFDLNGMVHRAWHGQPMNAGRLVVDQIAKVIRERQPTHVAAAADRPFPTFRHELCKTYKQNKERLPQGSPDRVLIQEQLRIAEEMLEDVLGIRTFAVRGYEGDDIVASLVALAELDGLDVLVVARDKDFSQLVTETTRLLDWTNGAISGPDEVVEKFGVGPECFADYLAIIGDSSDNVPGVYGCGPVAARAVLSAFPTLEKALVSAEAGDGRPPEERAKFWRDHPKIWARLAGSREVATMAKKLVTLARDVTLGVTAADLVCPELPEEYA